VPLKSHIGSNDSSISNKSHFRRLLTPRHVSAMRISSGSL